MKNRNENLIFYIFFLIFFFLNKTRCVKCSSNCDSCSSAEDWLTCPDGLFLYEKKCYESCPEETSGSGVGYEKKTAIK